MDPIINLAFALHANRGAYALLVGSGVSRAAGIPTGWEVVLDLIRKIAITCGEECDPDPEAWHLSKFGKEPDYSDIIDELGLTAVERSSILKEYFEPLPQDEEVLKKPTSAHKAIAQLVKAGYVRVIITTNFDRLIESALEAVGVHSTVISTPDAAEGVRPLAHSDCTLIKIHGDYLDTRIKNTVSELSEYDPRMNALLDRVCDEYGLIVCGWSGDWDPALRSAIERTKSNRYSTFWAVRSEPSQIARKLIELRRASMLNIDSADSFFVDIEEKVKALDDIGRRHPVSAQVAVATLKRHIVDEAQRIRMHDLITNEVERVMVQLSTEEFNVNEQWSVELFRRRVSRYEAEMETLVSLVAAGCYWGESTQAGLWTRCIERIAGLYRMQNGVEQWADLCLYPSLLLSYAGGISAMASGRLHNLRALILLSRMTYGGDEELVLQRCFPCWAFEQTAHLLKKTAQQMAPDSDHLHDVLRPWLAGLIPAEQDYTRAFDDFEYLKSLLFLSNSQQGNDQVWAPTGAYAWRGIYTRHTAMNRFLKRLDSREQAQELVSSGLFRSVDHARETAERFKKDVLSLIHG